ncbi:MAG: SIS domain-containing protein [Actinobacteria bacterium]|nr:SIS domain-containing protein [Actinomycetota bacterium]
MYREMADQPAVLERLVERFDDSVAAVGRLLTQPPVATVFLGRGSSDNAATLGRYAAEFASGRPAASAAPSLVTRYRAPRDYRGVLVVALSQSGRTPEIAATTAALREAGAWTVAITNDEQSPLADAAELTLALDAGPELAVPATKTVTAQLLQVLAVSAALGPLPLSATDLAALPAAVATELADADDLVALGQRWAEHSTLLAAARGLQLAAAQETALKIRETAQLTALGTSSADLLHGPIASVRAGSPVRLLDGDPATADDLAALQARLTDQGVDVARLGGRPQPMLLAPILATVRGQRLALELTLARGLSPDAPRGLSKVTVTH